MKLLNAYATPNAPLYLYALLLEREPNESISHKRMPTAMEHLAFVESRPYLAWYLVQDCGLIVGAIYLTDRREVGISIFRDWRGHGFGKRALALLRRRHPGPLLANVNPNNRRSRRFFESAGGGLLQVTYQL